MAKRFVRVKSRDTRTSMWGELRSNVIHLLDGAPYAGGKEIGDTMDNEGATRIAPVTPSKILAIGLNYHAHVEASQSADHAPREPFYFFKPPSSIIGPGDSIEHPRVSERVDYEAELGVVIGRYARRVSEEAAEDYIFGFTCVNDVTARDLQRTDKQWSRAKGFDTFCPVGPEIVTDLNWRDTLVEGVLNGEVKQSGSTALMIFSIPTLISYLSRIHTLEPGDLIATGTPAGIAPMQPGDEITVRIAGIGALSNHVTSEVN